MDVNRYGYGCRCECGFGCRCWCWCGCGCGFVSVGGCKHGVCVRVCIRPFNHAWILC